MKRAIMVTASLRSGVSRALARLRPSGANSRSSPAVVNRTFLVADIKWLAFP